jgi:dihydroneopterin aldolase
LTDTIALRGIRAFGRHGANAGEKDVPQPFDIDVVLDVDLASARYSDRLAETIDYAALHASILEIVATTSYDLLERIGQDVLDRILRDPRVIRAEVSIGKPRLLAGATPVVTLRQTRPRE